jgi:hypothetical protein
VAAIIQAAGGVDEARPGSRLQRVYGTGRDSLGKRRPFDQFHDDGADGAVVRETVHLGDVRVIGGSDMERPVNQVKVSSSLLFPCPSW